MRLISLPMYFLPEMASANAALWDELRTRLGQRGFAASEIGIDRMRSAVPGAIEPNVLFSQICGYPLFKRFRAQGRMLATPCYTFPGCSGPAHRGFFMVRSGDPAQRLEDLRGRVFGCNNLLSNSGMNLPRATLARIAGGKPFFSRVVMTGGHLPSLEQLGKEQIDSCSVDNVTWGFFKKYRPHDAASFRVLAETVPSPSLPFVTSSQTSEAETAVLTDTLFGIFSDPATLEIRKALEIESLAVPDLEAYEHLASYEEQARQMGYPDIV